MTMPEPIPFKTEGPQPLLRETPHGEAYTRAREVHCKTILTG